MKFDTNDLKEKGDKKLFDFVFIKRSDENGNIGRLKKERINNGKKDMREGFELCADYEL